MLPSGNADCSDHYLSDHYCYTHDPDDHNSIEEAVLPDGKKWVKETFLPQLLAEAVRKPVTLTESYNDMAATLMN